MLVYIKRTNQGGKGGHASEANSLVLDARDILAKASGSFPMGGAPSLSRGCGCLGLHPQTSVSPSPSQVQTVNAKGGEAPCGASPFPRCDCFPCGRPSSRQRDVCEPVSTWWAVLPGNHPGDSHFPDPRDANCLRTIIRSHNPGGSNFQHSPLCFRRNLSEFTHSSHWRPAHRIPDTFTGGSLLQAHVSGSSTTPP